MGLQQISPLLCKQVTHKNNALPGRTRENDFLDGLLRCIVIKAPLPRMVPCFKPGQLHSKSLSKYKKKYKNHRIIGKQGPMSEMLQNSCRDWTVSSNYGSCCAMLSGD